MTLAIVLWVIRSVAAALWVVDHATLAWRSRARGASWGEALVVPVRGAWTSGDRAAAVAWFALLVAYVACAVMQSRLR